MGRNPKKTQESVEAFDKPSNDSTPKVRGGIIEVVASYGFGWLIER